MASWKKMAEAFGRAVARGDRTSGKGADFIDKASQGARTNKAVDDAYNKGLREGYDDWDEVREKPGMQFDADELSDKEVRNRENAAFEQVDEEQSNKAMQSAFEQEFDKAVKRHTVEDPNRGKWSEDEVRSQAIDMLKSGADISDVLRFLRGDIDNVNIPD